MSNGNNLDVYCSHSFNDRRAHKTSLTPPLCIEISCTTNGKWVVIIMGVLEVSI